LQFDVAVASVFFTNSASKKHIFGERTECECVASHGSKQSSYLLINNVNKMYIVHPLYLLSFFSDSGQYHNIHVNFDTIYDHVTFLRWKLCCI